MSPSPLRVTCRLGADSELVMASDEVMAPNKGFPLFEVREWDGPAVLPPRTAQRMTGGLEARGAHRYVP
jgi:hypothetical protein